MKVIFLEAVQNFGGARKSTLELADRLKCRGNDVLIVDFWGSCKPFIEEVEKRNLSITFLSKREKPFLLYDQNTIKMVGNYIKYIRLWLIYRKKVKQIIKKFGAELIVVNNTKVLSILTKSKSYKIAYFARGWFLPKTISYINLKLFKALVDIFIAVSQSTRQAIFAGGFAKLKDINVVPNAINIKEIQNLLNPKLIVKPWCEEKSNRPFTILHCGGFLETKGQHIVLEVVNELKNKGFNFKVLLIGIIYKGDISEKYFKKIKALIDKYNLNENIEIILNKPNVIEYFSLCDVMIHPSYTEGLPRVVLEAMSLGKPVIGNAVGGMTDFILNNYTGYLTNFNDINDYVSLILKLASDKNLYKSISVNAKMLIEKNYTEENQCNSFMKIKL